MAKIGRNQSCPCGSGKKYKFCHGRISGSRSFAIQNFQAHKAASAIREKQQGLGRPIIGAKLNQHQIVAVGQNLYWSKIWKTFPDFLADYVKRKLGTEWGNAELKKPYANRHPILQWYNSYCHYQAKTIPKPGEIHQAQITGIVACYLGLAYALYLLDHNVELQTRLINRLKNVGNFQGAYYETLIASLLIRAGFILELEDEHDRSSKHCEFSATSKKTNKHYSVEAKMRSVAGLLGRTAADGGPDKNPLSRLVPHLNEALKKPARKERLVFIDLNAPPSTELPPDWCESAIDRLEQFEKEEMEKGLTAYVFITNFGFHRQLEVPPIFFALPLGLGIPDFNKPGHMSLTESLTHKGPRRAFTPARASL